MLENNKGCTYISSFFQVCSNLQKFAFFLWMKFMLARSYEELLETIL